MALTEHYHTKFDENCFYHIYNRTVDRKAMFKTDDNYRFFLKQYDLYLSPVLDTYAFCLLGNHFHMLVRVKDFRDFEEFSNKNGQQLPGISNKSTHNVVSHQFRKYFQSYAMAFNKQHDRIGTLFQRPFKRALVDSEKYYAQLVYYIHANPQLHGLIDNFRNWQWSSFGRVLIDKPSKLKKQEVIKWFGNVESYERYHDEHKVTKISEKYLLEDD